MRTTSISLLICIFFLLAVFPLTGLADLNKIESSYSDMAQNTIDDTIDQNQTGNCGNGIAIYNETMYAQSFKPSLGLITKVQLILSREGNLSVDAKIIVSIPSS